MRIRLAAIGLVCGLHAWAGQARDQHATFSVDYEAPEDCVGQAAFIRSILARSESARLASAEPAEVQFRASISEQAGLVRGVLLVGLGQGKTFRRTVPEAPCADVVASMAVIAAMVLDAVAAGTEIPAEATPESQPAPPASLALPQPVVPPPGPSVLPPAVYPANPRRVPVSVGLAGRVIAESAVAPGVFAGEEVGIDCVVGASELWLPGIRLSGLHVQSPTVHALYGDAEFRFLALRLRLCPTRWPAHSPVGLRLCANGDWGELRARGQRTHHPQTQRVTWWAAGPSARLEWLPWLWAGLEVEAGLVFPSRHDRFVFQPGAVPVHRVPAVGTSIGAGLVLRTP